MYGVGMAAFRGKDVELFADEFVISAGSVLFRISKSGHLTICILYNKEKDEWVLPKGRKDRGESMEQAAVRETYEETGFRCAIMPVNLKTRATIPGGTHENEPRLERLSREPFAMSMRESSDGSMKFIAWFVTLANGDGHQKGTQMVGEDFESTFFDADDAVGKLTSLANKKLAAKAVKLVKDTILNNAA